MSQTYPEVVTHQSPTTTSDADKYRQRLVQARVKTEEDLNKMSEDEIKKMFLKHEQSIVDGMANQGTEWFVKGYTKFVSKVLPIDGETDLEKSLNGDVFLQAAVKEFFPAIYYRFGAYFAPLSVALTTAAYVDYQRIKDKCSLTINEREEESKESATSSDTASYDTVSDD